MKKIFVIVSLLIMAACTAPPTNRETSSTANTNSATASAAPAMTEADAIAKEKAIWDAIKNKDYEGFAAMLADDQVEVRSEGVADKATSVDGVKQYEPSEVNFSEWKYLPINKDAFAVVYTVAAKAKFQGKELPLQTAHASSAWVNRGGKWLAIYHQECEVKPPPPPAKPGAPGKATPSPAASPASAPAAPPATGSDPIANEKIVWDLFKSKNYDAFAELLSPNFVEVERDNVFDKAGTVKGVAMFDASKAVLSDWKAVSINDDAAVVTYTIKGPGPVFEPQGERHSTIWIKREGKWMGLLHHGGTPVTKATAPPPPPSPAASKTPK